METRFDNQLIYIGQFRFIGLGLYKKRQNSPFLSYLYSLHTWNLYFRTLCKCMLTVYGGQGQYSKLHVALQNYCLFCKTKCNICQKNMASHGVHFLRRAYISVHDLLFLTDIFYKNNLLFTKFNTIVW